MTHTRPPIKWAGGKTRLLPQLLPHFPPSCDRYVEPFLGGGSVFLGSLKTTKRNATYLSDINYRLIGMYRGLRDNFEEVQSSLTSSWTGWKNDPDTYRLAKHAINNPQPQADLYTAVRMLYLNRTCFNGLWRENSRGEFNVPFGKYKTLSYPWVELKHLSEALRDASLEVQGFEQAMERVGSGDFVYLDPPYDPLTVTSNFTSYSAHDFGPKHQGILAELARSKVRAGAKVIASNHDTPKIRDLWGVDFDIIPVTVRRSISARGSSRGAVPEVILVSK